MADHVRRNITCVDATAEEAKAQDATGRPREVDPLIEARKLRMASLRRIAGIWADRNDIPDDGLLYERMLRDEWR